MRSNAPKSPQEAGQTVRMSLVFTVDLKKKIKEEAKKNFGKRKGAESMFVEQALRVHLHMNIEGVKEI